MKNNGMRIKHPKLRGEWAELCFMTRAAEHGLCVTKPWGETARYDFAVEHDGQFVRVQVKSTMFVDRGGYSCSVRGCRGPYQGNPFDFLAVYLIPEDLWYIIPAKKVKGQGSVALYPKLKKSQYKRYREAWGLLRRNSTFLRKTRTRTPEIEGVLECIEACAEMSSCQFPVSNSRTPVCGGHSVSTA
jgi:hypothetical protein